MYYNKFINFLIEHDLYHEPILNYWKNHKLELDYKDEEKREFYGCFYQTENGAFKNIKLIVPRIENDKTVLINIHEYIHLLLIFLKRCEKDFLTIDREVLPILFEKIYIKENSTEELQEYYKYITCFTEELDKEEYIIALDISDELLKTYINDNIYELDQQSKKMTRKYLRRPI